MGGKWGEKKTAHFFKNEKNGQAQKKKKRALDGGHKKTPFRKKRARFKKTKTWAPKKKQKDQAMGAKKDAHQKKMGISEKKKGAENWHIKK